MKEYLVKFRYINTGKDSHAVVPVYDDDPDVTLPINDLLKERWRGLLCDNGGLRSIVEITELPLNKNDTGAKPAV